VETEYKRISWRDYQSVFITMPSWFVNIPTENILMLSNLIGRESPDSRIFFFGNSLGSWSDENNLRRNKVTIIHLNDLFEMNPANEPVNYDALPTPIYEKREKYIFNILPFRLKHGCIWGQCRFCSLAKGWNSGYTERSAKKVIREIEELIDIYNPKMLVCSDNTINGKNLMEFCTHFKIFKKPWIGMARADLTEHDITALQKADCRLIYFGLESGSERVLKEINKGINTKQMSDFIMNLHNHSIMPAPSVFVGSPKESEIDFKKTIQFIVDHRYYLDILNVFPFMMTPGSDYFIKNRKSNPSTLNRLNKLVKICTEIGIKVCIGEQSDEYVICKKAYPDNIDY
jgi:radical SAM superfamily enzyme YgiQ (UPF0313 family)